MKSKISLVNKTLFLHNIKRFWPLWALVSIMNTFGVLMMVISLSDVEKANRALEGVNYLCEAITGAAPVECFLYAVVVALAVWGFMYHPSQLRFMHSLPANRASIFVTQYLTGLVLMFIPFGVSGILYILSAVCMGCFSIRIILESILFAIMLIVIFFSIATLIAMLTMNRFSYAIMYFFFSFLGPVMEASYYAISDLFCLGTYNWNIYRLKFLSPALYIGEKFSYWYAQSDPASKNKFIGVGCLVSYFLVGLAFTGISYLLYKVIRSENVGNVISFAPLQKVMLYLFTALGTIYGSLILYELLSFNALYVKPLWYFVCVVIACVVNYFGLLMIIQKSLRVFNKKAWLKCGMVVVAFGAVVVGFWYDIFDISHIHPKMDDIQSVDFWIGPNDYYFEPGKQDVELDKVFRFMNSVADRRSEFLAANMYEDDATNAYISTNITLKDGTMISNGYRVLLYQGKEATDGTLENDIYRLLSSPDMISNRLNLNVDRFDLNYAVINCLTSQSSIYLSSMETSELMDALILDASEGNWNGFEDIYEEYGDGDYVIDIELSFEDRNNFYGDWERISLNDSMKHTVSFILSKGWISEENMVYKNDYYSDDYYDQTAYMTEYPLTYK